MMQSKPTQKAFFSEVQLLDTPVFNDARGELKITFALEKFRAITGFFGHFVQDLETFSYQGVLRGLHYQCPKAQGKLIRVTHGEILDVVVDMRLWSDNYGRWASYPLNAKLNQTLWIPPGFAHGYLVLSPTAWVSYKLTQYRFEEYEKSLLWNDESLNIQWQYPQQPLLSARDVVADTWQQACKYLLVEDLL